VLLHNYGWTPGNGQSLHQVVRTSEKENEVNCFILHCIIHLESFCWRVIEQSSVKKTVIKVTNLIRDGTKSLSHYKFRALLDEMDGTYGDLLLHSEIRWLCLEKC
jgi:hypothetical protein